MKKIEVVSIPVTDQQKSKEFYQKLGFNVLAEAPFSENQTWVQLGYSGDTASITLVTWFKTMPPGCVNGLVIKTKDVETDQDELTAMGITTSDIDETPWGKFLTVKDPDGNTISFRQE